MISQAGFHAVKLAITRYISGLSIKPINTSYFEVHCTQVSYHSINQSSFEILAEGANEEPLLILAQT